MAEQPLPWSPSLQGSVAPNASSSTHVCSPACLAPCLPVPCLSPLCLPVPHACLFPHTCPSPACPPCLPCLYLPVPACPFRAASSSPGPVLPVPACRSLRRSSSRFKLHRAPAGRRRGQAGARQPLAAWWRALGTSRTGGCWIPGTSTNGHQPPSGAPHGWFGGRSRWQVGARASCAVGGTVASRGWGAGASVGCVPGVAQVGAVVCVRTHAHPATHPVLQALSSLWSPRSGCCHPRPQPCPSRAPRIWRAAPACCRGPGAPGGTMWSPGRRRSALSVGTMPPATTSTS